MTALLNGDRVEDITDPVAYVARESGLDPEKLWNVMQGKTGFGRGSKSKPGPNGSAAKWGFLGGSPTAQSP